MWHRTVKPEELKELPPKARQLFVQFYNISGGSITHPNDHRRFNEFVRHCHAKKVRLSESAFKALLKRIGCTEVHIQKLSTIYYYGRELLKCSCP